VTSLLLFPPYSLAAPDQLFFAPRKNSLRGHESAGSRPLGFRFFSYLFRCIALHSSLFLRMLNGHELLSRVFSNIPGSFFLLSHSSSSPIFFLPYSLLIPSVKSFFFPPLRREDVLKLAPPFSPFGLALYSKGFSGTPIALSRHPFPVCVSDRTPPFMLLVKAHSRPVSASFHFP